MDHPNIAKVLDAGAHRRGRPFFVMELVKGVPITEYCDARTADPARAPGAVRPGLPGHPARPSERDHPPRHQAVATCWSRCTTTGPCRRSSTSAWPRRSDQQLTEQTLFTGFGAMLGTPAVHVAGAGRAQQPGRRHAERRLLAGRAALRTADRDDRRSSERLKQAASDGDAPHHSRGGAAAAEHAALEHARKRCQHLRAAADGAGEADETGPRRASTGS